MTADISDAEILREIAALEDQLDDLQSALRRLRETPEQQPQQQPPPVLDNEKPPRRHRAVRGGHNAQGGIERHGQEPWRSNRFR